MCFMTSSLTDGTIRYGSLMYGRKVVPKCQVYSDHRPSTRNCNYGNNLWLVPECGPRIAGTGRATAEQDNSITIYIREEW